ncbi:hypothetical protein OG301_39170 (plasmid) [Streptomyces platensis]|uniref:hypothetical protein n=1 Tax=Streptomyces platensis TaxID=58346 RepID=UPI002ED09FE3|nr:hypothetical protein OG301_39170 [Streptomyces platensis]
MLAFLNRRKETPMAATSTAATSTMTAADHFRAGEQLLAEAAEPGLYSDFCTAHAARAQAHFAAARLLLDADPAGDATRNTGLWSLAYDRRAS